MSSSNVLRRFSLADDSYPVGSDDFIQRFLRERQEESSEGRQLRELEEKHRIELQQVLQNGLTQGDSAGYQRGIAEARRVEANLSAVISEVTKYQHTLYDQAKGQLLELAFAIANKITSARAESERGTVLETIERCVAEILDKSKIKVRVNPSQHDFVKASLDKLRQGNDAINSITVESDARVAVGGCIVETDSGSADARMESQLQMMHDKLLSTEQ